MIREDPLNSTLSLSTALLNPTEIIETMIELRVQLLVRGHFYIREENMV
jgi:hypothetical protein